MIDLHFILIQISNIIRSYSHEQDNSTYVFQYHLLVGMGIGTLMGFIFGSYLGWMGLMGIVLMCIVFWNMEYLKEHALPYGINLVHNIMEKYRTHHSQ